MPATGSLAITYRLARPTDVPALNALIGQFAAKHLMLPRPMSELYDTIRDFIVAEAEVGGLVGCAAVHIATDKIAELKALAVAEAGQGKGIGKKLVQACFDEARRLGLERLFCLTYQVDFFTKLGFTRVDRSRLPEKVWGECVRCHRFLDCDEVAMWRTVDMPAVSVSA
ncbi:MAG: N-acetyltransferase [Planctomycetes bacterium]|nr:N-acetyltransferase [Planctomycetota bacterium]